MCKLETLKEPRSIQQFPEPLGVDHEPDQADIQELTEPPKIPAELVVEEVSRLRSVSEGSFIITAWAS